MKIVQLDIEGFRSLKNVSWKPGSLNVIIGPNGSGKSNLLASFFDHKYNPSTAYAINNDGRIVGQGPEGAFLYQNGTMSDLNDFLPAGSGWVLRQARGINDRGQIVGSGQHDGKDRAFLMTPIKTL